MKLVIVESPNKCQTISKYLGKGYNVLASKGHLRDLAICGKEGLGVNIEDGFIPTYEISESKMGVVNKLKEEKNKASEVILATDPDREGEAIAWHLCQILGLDINQTKRLEFHEITRSSITKALEDPRLINMNLVNSQEARRIMDRIIGFRLSSLLKKKMNSQSAGRVQSATLKIICDHENEIINFVPEEYWTLAIKIKANKTLKANYYQFNNENFKITNKDDNDLVVKSITDKVKVTSVTSSTRSIESKPAFKTSTLQQEAFNAYHFSTTTTQKLAQELYEGLNIGGEHVGLITYIRTDSTALSDTYVYSTKEFIKNKFGEQYLGKRKLGKKALYVQEAHEAIRPTSNERTPEKMEKYLTAGQYKLYKLIYERAIASLMAPKQEDVTTVIFNSNNVSFKLEGSKTSFDGFTALLEEKKKDISLPEFKIGEEYPITDIINEQKFTEPPERYSEAKIVKIMEEKGIGRPSTYASTISILKLREYIEVNKGIIFPTENGMRTSYVLNKYFPNIVDATYTANMETKLDDILEGKETKIDILNSFYNSFNSEYQKASEIMYKDPHVETGEICPVCNSPLVIKHSKYGEFVCCSNYPKCNYIKKEPQQIEYTGENCPECGKPLIVRKGPNGNFVGCSGYPNCRYIKPVEKPKVELKVVKKCPQCGGDMVVNNGPYSRFLGCSNYPNCKYQEKIKYKSYKK